MKTTLKDLMTPDPEVVRPEANVVETAKRMRDLEVGMIPVCDGERIAGIVTDRDITVRATAEGRDPAATRVSDVMSSGLVYCFENQAPEEAAEAMEKNQIRRLVVLTRDKKMAGLVSLGDLAVRSGKRELSGEALEKVSEPSKPVR